MSTVPHTREPTRSTKLPKTLHLTPIDLHGTPNLNAMREELRNMEKFRGALWTQLYEKTDDWLTTSKTPAWTRYADAYEHARQKVVDHIEAMERNHFDGIERGPSSSMHLSNIRVALVKLYEVNRTLGTDFALSLPRR